MIDFRTMRATVALPFLLALSSGSLAASLPDTGELVARPDGNAITQAVLPAAQPPHLDVDGAVDDDSVSTPAATDATASATVAAADDRQVDCVAKVIMHEAGYEPEKGRIAVAQVIRARMKQGGRFPETACAVVKQHGQFFDVDAYNPPHNDRWDDAVAIARETLAGQGDDVAPGALFFHAASSRGAWVGARTRVAQIGGHVFFR